MRQVAPLVVVEDDAGGRGRGGCRHHGTPTVAVAVAVVVAVVGGGVVVVVVVVVVVSMVNIVAWCDNSGVFVVNRKRLWWRSKSSRGRLKEPLLIVAEVSVKEKCAESMMDDDG